MNKNKPLVFKLDGVVRDFVKHLNLKLEDRDYIDYDYSNWYLNNQYDKNCDEIANNPIFWKNTKPFDDAWYQINYWFNNSFQIIIISDSYHLEKDEDWLDSWRIPFNKIISSRSEIIDELKILNPSIIVDDKPSNISNYQSANLNGVLRRAWYNRDQRDDFPNIGNFFDIKGFND